MTTDEMISELRAMQRQIIHGTKFFGEVADRLEELRSDNEATAKTALPHWICEQCLIKMPDTDEGFLGENGVCYCSEKCYENHMANL